MKKLALIAMACTASLALAACGETDDASADAMADTVEMPADEAMAAAPEPVEAIEATPTEDVVAEDTTTAAADAAEAAVADVEAAAAATGAE
jgi:hypothetical protein